MSDPLRPAGLTPAHQPAAAARPAGEAPAAPTKEQIESFVADRRDSLVDHMVKANLIKPEHAAELKAGSVDQWSNVFHGWGGGGHGGGWGHGGGGGWGHGGPRPGPWSPGPWGPHPGPWGPAPWGHGHHGWR
ncbi:MAG TPA: hypothetical protein VGO93_09335 [Candidatus Xenobia bacterium]|jgi:hypothetical protein